jgi:maltose O-acetyltransferase
MKTNLSVSTMWSYPILLQLKFFLVMFLNLIVSLIPYPLRNMFLQIWGIKIPFSSSIHRGVKFFHIGNVVVGTHSVINFGCYLDNRRKITIGNNVGIAHNTKIYTLGHDIGDPQFKTKGKDVTIKDNVFIFSNVLNYAWYYCRRRSDCFGRKRRSS